MLGVRPLWLMAPAGLACLLLGTSLAPLVGRMPDPSTCDTAAWARAIIASRARLRLALAGKPTPIQTGVFRGGMPAERVEIDLTGQTELYLQVLSAPTYDYGQSVWCEPELVTADGSSTRLTQQPIADHTVGWGTLLVDKSVSGDPIRVAGRQMAFGLWAHADSLLHYRLDRPYKLFRALVGIDDNAGTNGHVRFVVSTTPPGLLQDPLLTAEPDRLIPELSPHSHRLMLGDLDVVGLELEARRLLEERDRAALVRQVQLVDRSSLQQALKAYSALAPDRYRDADALRAQVSEIPNDVSELAKRASTGDAEALALARRIVQTQRDIVLRHPTLDFDRVLAIRRGATNEGLPANFNSNSDLPRRGYDNSVMEYSVHQRFAPREVFRPSLGRFVGDLCLHFDADRFLFSMPSEQDRWHVWEMVLGGSTPRQVTPDMGDDVDNYDACYLPSGDVLFTSTAGMVAVPCVGGASHVATLFRLTAGGTVSQLCFDQEHNWTPRVMADGTVLYQRWEYTDTPHSNTRLLFTMNPDGTNQREFYGSNSYWPAAFFYAQPIPGKPSQVVGISTGHHGPARTGELVILDTTRGRQEGAGVVRSIGGNARPFRARIYDHMLNVWPSFVHPAALSEQIFLVSCQPSPNHPRGIYVADIFDNLVEIASEPGRVLLEPNPVLRRKAPPVIPDRIDPTRRDAVLDIQDIYRGPGLQGIPRGTVQAVRVLSYTFGYRGVGGLHGVIGLDGPWDIHRVLGTAPVRPDGSASIRVPANTPLSLQPVDRHGQALALMRSWLTARPGETLSCVGCHEPINSGPPPRRSRSASRPPAAIRPWRPKVVGFSFEREVQPVLDRHCVRCHEPGRAAPDLRGGRPLRGWSSRFSGSGLEYGGRFSESYAALFPFVRNNGIEGDYHVLAPMEFHFSATELGKMLRKGHHGVRLPAADWVSLVTWHDANRPYHGSWSSIVGARIVKAEERRAELRKRYGNVDENHEAPAPDRWTEPAPTQPFTPAPVGPIATRALSATETLSRSLRGAAPGPTSSRRTLALDLGAGLRIELVRVPAGAFAMGSVLGHADERPMRRVRIERPFWMARLEVSNAQFRAFDRSHDSRVADALSYQFGRRPWSLNEPDQPVCRVSWRQAMAFCRWLSSRSGRRVTLPTEAQWEYACRAGSNDAYSFGGFRADYTPYANLGDRSLSLFVADTSAGSYHAIETITNPTPFDDWIPKDPTRNDGRQLAAKCGSYRPNAWGLHDMHGNVAEWTRSLYRAYPYADGDGRNDIRLTGERVARGGSWWTRPLQGTASHRVPYADYQPVMDTGFRVIVED